MARPHPPWSRFGVGTTGRYPLLVSHSIQTRKSAIPISWLILIQVHSDADQSKIKHHIHKLGIFTSATALQILAMHTKSKAYPMTSPVSSSLENVTCLCLHRQYRKSYHENYSEEDDDDVHLQVKAKGCHKTDKWDSETKCCSVHLFMGICSTGLHGKWKPLLIL